MKNKIKSKKNKTLSYKNKNFIHIADYAPVMIWVADKEKACIHFNKPWLDFTGRRLDEELGNGWAEGVHSEDLQDCLKIYEQAFEKRQSFRMEYRLKRYDGQYRWILDTGAPMYEERGRFSGYMGSCIDITEIKNSRSRLQKVNSELRTQVRKFERVIESVPNGIVIVNSEGEIVLVNQQMETLFGYSREELMGEKIEFLIPPRFKEKHPHYRDSFVKDPRVKLMGEGRDLYGLHRDGHEIPIEIGLNPIETDEGLLILGSIIDVTKRKQLDDIKDNFLSTVSHELRTPLSILKMGIDNLEADRAWTLNDEEKEMVGMLKKNTDRLEKLINDLLDFARLESGKIKFNPKTIDFVSITREVVDNFQLPAREKNIHIIIESKTPYKIIKADPELMIRVLTNLINNALRYTNSEIIVSLAEKEDHLYISVIDDGDGIAEKHLSSLFNKFVQIQRPVGGAGYKGTGLGLAICREIIQLHQGKIWAESALGLGTKFIFKLPLPSYDT